MWRYFQRKKEAFLDKILKPIPEEFFSFETGEPFSECVECKGPIGHSHSDYIIEKCYQDDEVIYEYALCDDCSKDLRGEMSKESTKYLKKAMKLSLIHI